MKTCSKCGELKDNFNILRKSKDGLKSWCRDCEKLYRTKNNEIILGTRRRYYRENKEQILLRNKKWKEENSEYVIKSRVKYYNENLEKMLEYKKNYRKKNKDAVNSYNHKRRSIARKLPSTLTTKEWREIKEYFNYRCAYCGKEKPLQQEHFLALSKGGEYTHNNIVPACALCNLSKKDKNFFKWYPTCKIYSKKREKKILDYLNYKNGVQQLTFSVNTD
jgi:hypothetical protein